MDEKPFRRLSPQTAAVLRPYACWSVLPRARRRAARGRIATSTPKYARVRITVAEQFLTWLEDNDIALADATQRDVNTWLGLGATPVTDCGTFSAGRTPAGWPQIWRSIGSAAKAWPSRYSHDEHWVLLRRCLRDDSPFPRLRVAGALVLLYGQIPSRIVELTIDQVTTTDQPPTSPSVTTPSSSHHRLPR